ncbi:unnamed protein product [Rhizopus stolonifer]
MTTSDKILRPMNSFMLYRVEKQQEIVKECPGANHRDISKIIAKWWKELSEEDKRPYRQKADSLKNEHRKLHPDYKFSPRKRSGKTRKYKKRPQHELAPDVIKNKKQLNDIYKRGSSFKGKADDIITDIYEEMVEERDAIICKSQAINSTYIDMLPFGNYDNGYLHPCSSSYTHSLSTSPVMSSYSISSVSDDYGFDRIPFSANNQDFDFHADASGYLNQSYGSPNMYYNYDREYMATTSEDESAGVLHYPRFIDNNYLSWGDEESQISASDRPFSSFLTCPFF